MNASYRPYTNAGPPVAKDPLSTSGGYELPRMHTPNSSRSNNTGDNSTDGRLVTGEGLGLEKIETTGRADEVKGVGSDSYSWALVLVALLLSIVALGCVIGLLRRFDQRPIDEWPMAVSLSTIVSILASIARASLAFAIGACIAQGKWNWFAGRTDSLIAFDRFEDASKGPWGCLRLLPTVARRGYVSFALCLFSPLLFYYYCPV